MRVAFSMFALGWFMLTVVGARAREREIVEKFKIRVGSTMKCWISVVVDVKLNSMVGFGNQLEIWHHTIPRLIGIIIKDRWMDRFWVGE
jgi:hypothetical protein